MGHIYFNSILKLLSSISKKKAKEEDDVFEALLPSCGSIGI